MKIVLAIIVALILFLVVSCVYRNQEKAVHRYAQNFGLTEVDPPDQKIIGMGPFFYRDKSQTIWSMLVRDRDGKPATMWIRFSTIDDVILVYPDGKEIELK